MCTCEVPAVSTHPAKTVDQLAETPPTLVRIVRCCWLAWISLSLFSGCQPVTPLVAQPPAVHLEVHAPLLIQRTRRIAAMCFENNTRFRDIGHAAPLELASAMRRQGCCELVNMNHVSNAPCPMDAVLRAEYPIATLAGAWRHLHADAVMFSRINEFSPYPPLSLGITIRVVDAADAVLIGALDQHWTLADPQVLAAYEVYLHERFPHCRHPEVYLSSPLVFTQFVMLQVASEWCRARGRASLPPGAGR